MGDVTSIDKKRKKDQDQYICSECGGNIFWLWADESVQCVACGTHEATLKVVLEEE